VSGKYADEKADLNPRSWLSKYRQTSIRYMIKMALFYHGLGYILALIGAVIAQQIIPEYEAPLILLTLAETLSAGPFEETIFFGIPFYATGNHYVVMGMGIVWALGHILNTEILELSNLAYENLLFVIPTIFFSLRTWASGKGWFAIIVHSSWNGIIFVMLCTAGEIQCRVFGNNVESLAIEIGTIVSSGVLLAITYKLYLWRRNRERQLGSV